MARKKAFIYKKHWVTVVKPEFYAVSVGGKPPFFNKKKAIMKKYIDKHTKK